MQNVANHSRKIKRAITLSKVGAYPASASEMLDAMPATIIPAVTSRQLADMLDAAWSLAQASKAIAARDALADGGLWDAKANTFRAFA